MPSFEYLIVGGGMTADAAARGIRDVDKNGSIGVVSSEPVPPYNRPPLTKGLWKGKPLSSIWRNTEKLAGVVLHLGRTVRQIDPQAKTILDEQETVYTYGKLLLATGGTPRRLPFGGDDIIYFRTHADYERLRALADQHSRFAVIGGGFIGSEIAAALAMNGKQAVMVFPDKAIGSRMFPADLAGFVNDYYRQKGIELVSGAVTGMEKRGKQFALSIEDAQTKSKREIVVDGVIAGIGIQPNLQLAESAGLKTDDGILVDSALRTSHSDIYAAGDVARFVNPALGRRMRVEHEDNANTMGRMAGQSMAGQQVSYDHLPYFYSDLFDLGYEAAGEVDSRLETFADWQVPFKKGVIYYLRDGRVRGVLLWNVWEQVDAARRLIAEPGPFKPADLQGKLPAAER